MFYYFASTLPINLWLVMFLVFKSHAIDAEIFYKMLFKKFSENCFCSFRCP